MHGINNKVPGTKYKVQNLSLKDFESYFYKSI